MLMGKNWIFQGISGDKYTFESYSKSTELPGVGGIYILVYAHPRGHLAGFQINILAMGSTDNLNGAVSGLQQSERLMTLCWNYNYVLSVFDPETRDRYLEDLKGNNPIRF